MAATLAAAFRPEHARSQPYPHYLAFDALPADDFRRLTGTLPADERIRAGARPGNNIRFSWPAAQTLADPALPAAWREFIAAHVSQPFLEAVLAAFAPAIRSRYPWLEERLGPIERWRAGLRRRDGFDRAHVLMDAQICLNSPVLRTASSVRGPHVDRPDKLFAGLYYLRPDEDVDTVGGELLIQRCRDPDACFDGTQLEPAAVQTVERVPYRGNTFLMFLNGPGAVHAVTPRQPTSRSRYFLNLVGEIPCALFDLRSRQRPLRPLRRLTTRVGDFFAGRRTAPGRQWD